MIGKCSIGKLNELNQAYLHKLFTNDKVYVFRFLRLLLHCWLFRRDLDPSLSWRSDEPSITRNDQSRPCGRHTLIGIDLIRLEAVCVAMLCTRWMCCTRCEASSIFFKDVIKVGFKVLVWWFERNMLVCFFRLLTENGFGFAFITKFSKIVVWTSPGAFDVLKVDVLNLLTSPGAFESLCQVFSFWVD